jgi:hypothetical protein
MPRFRTSTTREDNQHITVSGLTEGKWTELDLNHQTRGATMAAANVRRRRRMDDFKVHWQAGAGASCELFIDDVIFYATIPRCRRRRNHPNRDFFSPRSTLGRRKSIGLVIEIVEQPPAGVSWRCEIGSAQDGKALMVRLRAAASGGAHTKVRFRYHLNGASAMAAQIFDAAVQDNRHVNLRDLKIGEWITTCVDFTRDSRRNDGTRDTFRAGNKVDDLFSS